MGWFTKKGNELQETRLHGFLSAAFQKVKHDTSTLFSWIHYFNSKHEQHEQRLAEIENQLYYMPKTSEEIKHIIDSHYSLEPIKERITELRQRIQDLEKVRHEPQIITQPVERIIEKPQIRETQLNGSQKSEEFLRIVREKPFKSQIHEKLARKIIKNSKDYLKSVIFSIIRRYGEISASKLKEMIVEEQGLCSKSSFYRLLGELEKEESFAIMTKGKEKIYLLKNERYINK